MRSTTLTRPALALGVASLALALSAFSPITTDEPYAASDGIRAQVGDLEVLNLMIVTEGDGGSGRLLGAASSSSGEPDVLTIAAEDGSIDIPVQLDAGQTVNFSAEDDREDIERVSAAAGTNLLVTLTDGSGASVEVHVPVLDGTLAEYADVVQAD